MMLVKHRANEQVLDFFEPILNGLMSVSTCQMRLSNQASGHDRKQNGELAGELKQMQACRTCFNFTGWISS
jgi:hypothetical protein